MDPITLPNKTITYYPYNPTHSNPNFKPVMLGSCMSIPSRYVSLVHADEPNNSCLRTARKQVRFAEAHCTVFFDDSADTFELCGDFVPMTPPKISKINANKINYVNLAGGATPKNKYSKNQHLKQTNLNFKHPITNNELCIAKVPGDGSCQFHALTYKTELSSISLRKQVAAHIKHNPAVKEYIYNDSIENYTKHMLLSTTWGDQNTLAAAADVLNSYIHVFSKTTNTQLFSPSHPNSDTLTVCVF